MASGKKTLTVQQLEGLIPALQRRGYQVVGPVVREGAIVYDVVEKLSDLPAGWTDEQAPGRYRLQRRSDQALFGYVVGPHSWKKYLHPPEIRLFSAERQDGTLRILNNTPPPPRRAFLGVRACELAAIAVQDRVLQGDRYNDPIYSARREGIFIVAVNCTQAAPTCFCTSMKTGPQVERGFDLALTELVRPEKHEFLVEAGSDAGAELLAELESAPASAEICAEAKAAVESAAAQIQRHMDTTNIRDLLAQNFDHPRWDNVAQRCLTCANCTMVCPTCFCTTVEDVSDVTGDHAERWRRWDSCFTPELLLYPRRQCALVRQIALPAVDDSQAGVRGSTNSAVPVAWAADAALPGARWVSTLPKRCAPSGKQPHLPRKTVMETLERIVAEHPFFAGLEAQYIKPAGRMRGQRALRRRHVYL